jgi:hypothetical protein
MVLYLSKLSPHGVLIFNIVNRFLNLGPVLGNLARDAGLVSLVPTSAKLSKPTADIPPAVSDGPHRVDFGILANDSRKTVLPYRPDMPAWTDDFSNILSIIHWD